MYVEAPAVEANTAPSSASVATASESRSVLLTSLFPLSPRGEVEGDYTTGLGQVEVQRVPQLDSRVRSVHRHVARHVEERLRVVEDDLDAGVDEVVRRVLRVVGGNGEHPHDDVLVADAVPQLRVGADLDVPERVADLLRVAVVDRGDVDPVLAEDRRARDRLAEAAGADERDVVLPLRAQDLADLVEQRLDVVADPALAELAETGEVAPDLRRVDVRVVGDLLRGDPLLPHLLRLRQHLEVAAEACCDADGQAVRHACSFRRL